MSVEAMIVLVLVVELVLALVGAFIGTKRGSNLGLLGEAAAYSAVFFLIDASSILLKFKLEEVLK